MQPWLAPSLSQHVDRHPPDPPHAWGAPRQHEGGSVVAIELCAPAACGSPRRRSCLPGSTPEEQRGRVEGPSGSRALCCIRRGPLPHAQHQASQEPSPTCYQSSEPLNTARSVQHTKPGRARSPTPQAGPVLSVDSVSYPSRPFSATFSMRLCHQANPAPGQRRPRAQQPNSAPN